MRIFKRLTLLLAFCLAMLGCGAALADVTITPVPAERIQYAPRLGLVLTAQKQNGQIQFKIDPEKTDWPTVLTYSLTGEGTLDVGANVVLPTDANVKYYMWLLDLGSNPTEAQIRQAIAQAQAEAEMWGGSAYWSRTGEDDAMPPCFVTYAEYNASEKLIALRENTHYVTICYFDADKNLLYAETVSGTSASASSTRQIPNVEKNKIAKGNVTANVDGRKGFSVTLNDGDLVYSVEDPTAVDGNRLKTRIKTPEGTVRIVRYQEGFIWDDDPIAPDRDGYYTFTNQFQLGDMEIRDFSYAFLDANGNILPGSGQLRITIVDDTANRLSLHFLKDDTWNPVPASRFRSSISGGSGMVKAPYEDALVHLSADKQGRVSEVDARKLPGAQKDYQVQAPTDAKAYRIAGLGGGNAFGPGNAQSYQGFLKSELSKSTLHTVQGGQWVNAIPNGWGQSVFFEFAKSKNNSILYSVAAETEKGRASFFAVEWFSDTQGQNSLGVEWFGENADDLTLKPQTYTVPSHSHVTRPLDGPAMVGQYEGLILYAEFQAQSGSNSYVIELKLMDEEGNVITDYTPYLQDGAMEFYIPYPEGQSVSNANTYSVTHYLDADLSSSEPALEMSCEVGGIRFKVRSLSPIELSWQGSAASGTVPPKTGDDSHTALWLMLCLLSLCAMAVIVRRQRKA